MSDSEIITVNYELTVSGTVGGELTLTRKDYERLVDIPEEQFFEEMIERGVFPEDPEDLEFAACSIFDEVHRPDEQPE